MADKKQRVGRVAMRVEGDWWVAYYAMPDTMHGADELGRIRMVIVQDRARKTAFMGLMMEFIAELLRAATGKRPDFITSAAPEHERAGRA